ncbi:MAG: O-antigen ligase family protein [Terriglobales bacterium]
MIQQILIGLALLIGAGGCLFNPFIGMLTLMGVNVIQPGELYPVFSALHTERVMALLVLVVVLVRGVKFAFPKPTRWCLMVYAAALASIPLAFWISNAVTNAIDFAKVIILSVLLVTLANTRARLQAVLATFSVLVTYLAVSSLISYFQGNFQFRMGVDRLVGLTSASNDPNELGLTLVTALPLMYLLTQKPVGAMWRWAMRAMLALCVWALLLTGSRGSVLTLVMVLAVAALASRRRWRIVPAALVAGVVVWSFLPAQYKVRYESVNDLQNDMSYQNRVTSWRGGWHMFLSNPVTGIGIGDYTVANGAKFWPAPGRKIYLNAHSLYFQTLGELGLVGVFAFGGFLVVLFRSNAELRREMAAHPDVPAWMRYYPLACNLSLLGLLYNGYASHDLYRNTWYFLAATTGALLLIRQKELAAEPAPGSDLEPAAEARMADLAPPSGRRTSAAALDWSVQP